MKIIKQINNIKNKKKEKDNISYTNIKTSVNNSAKKNMKKKDRVHSSIFNYEGLKTAVSKYNNSIKSENKSINSENPIFKNKNNDINSLNNNNSIEKIKSLSKLKEMNSNMDLILTGIKDELDCINNYNEKKNINLDKFIQQIDNKKDSSLSSDSYKNNKKQKSIPSIYYSFSFMRINNFYFKIINKKKYIVNIDELSEEQQIKMKYAFNKNLENKFYLDDIINNAYNYKTKIDDLKKSNYSVLSRYLVNEDYFNEVIKKNFEFNKIEYENEIIKKQIDVLKEKLTNSIYNGDLLLKRYNDKLNIISNIIQRNINGLTNDILNKN